MTERESAHPLQGPLCDFSPLNEHCDNTNVQDVEMSKLSIKENHVNDEISQKTTVNQVRDRQSFGNVQIN